MGIDDYTKIMQVSSLATLPIVAKEGQLAYIGDVKKYYMFLNGTWATLASIATAALAASQIPHQKLQKALIDKGVITQTDIDAVIL